MYVGGAGEREDKRGQGRITRENKKIIDKGGETNRERG